MNILLALACAALLHTAEAAPLRPHSSAYGRSLSDWASVWTQWVMAIDSDRNPSTDRTGEFAREGQSGCGF